MNFEITATASDAFYYLVNAVVDGHTSAPAMLDAAAGRAYFENYERTRSAVEEGVRVGLHNGDNDLDEFEDRSIAQAKAAIRAAFAAHLPAYEKMGYGEAVARLRAEGYNLFPGI
jgi:Xaa-Pro aminopeptidase